MTWQRTDRKTVHSVRPRVEDPVGAHSIQITGANSTAAPTQKVRAHQECFTKDASAVSRLWQPWSWKHDAELGGAAADRDAGPEEGRHQARVTDSGCRGHPRKTGSAVHCEEEGGVSVTHQSVRLVWVLGGRGWGSKEMLTSSMLYLHAVDYPPCSSAFVLCH